MKPTPACEKTVVDSGSLGVYNKLDHLANAVLAINSRLGVMGNEMQELKAKSNSSRAWEDVLNLSRVSVGQEPFVPQTVQIPIATNNVPVIVTQAASAAKLVTVQDLRRDPGLVHQANTRQQAFQARNAQDVSQGRVAGDNINNNNLHDVHSRGHNSNFHNVQSDLHSRVHNGYFPSIHNHGSSQNSNTNIKSG